MTSGPWGKGILVKFGPDTDGDTLANIFRGLTPGWVISVNHQPVEVTSIDFYDTPGIGGRAWDEQAGEAIEGAEFFWPWTHIDSIEIL